MRARSVLKVVVGTAAVGLITAGCLSEDGGGGGGGGGGEGGGDGVVEIYGAFSGDEETRFNDALTAFEEESGLDLQYTSTADFDTLIRSRVAGGNPPELALFPQPGLLVDLANEGELVPLADAVDLDAIEETLIPGFTEASTGEDGQVYGVPMRMAVKSLTWFPVPEFEEAGYAPAESTQQLVELTDQIKADGTTPWCFGMESGAASGWPMTDWLEEYVLRVGGPDVYDQWVSHEIPFNDPVVVEAGEAIEELLFTEGNVIGGNQGIQSTPFGESANPMFADPPGCMLHRQGNFVTGFFPAEIQADLPGNVNLFVFPPYEGGYDGQPILGGGDLAALFDAENEEAIEALEFLASPEFGGPWAEAGGWLSPHTTFDTSLYPDEVTAEMHRIAAEADVFRFDGSDLMPGAVGTGTFWTGMVDWVGGAELETVLQQIEDSWPAEQ